VKNTSHNGGTEMVFLRCVYENAEARVRQHGTPFHKQYRNAIALAVTVVALYPRDYLLDDRLRTLGHLQQISSPAKVDLADVRQVDAAREIEELDQSLRIKKIFICNL
jgi:hypothetical protein